MKGAYWHPDPMRYHDSINEQQPSAWHKDHSCYVVQRAAVAAMTDGYDPEHFMRCHTDPYDFMLRAKVSRGDKLLHGDQEQQKITRYYVSADGKPLLKVSPPVGEIGAYKRRNKLTDGEYHAIASTLPAGQWDERIHTSNKSRYEMRSTAINAGYLASICNNARDFRFANLNYDWYVQEARKLIIA